MPSYDALNNFVSEADPEALAKALNAWLATHQDKLPKSLALDGKDLTPALGAIVTLCRHEDGRPVAMASYSDKKDDSELPVAQELLKQSGEFLENATITSDALHTQKKRIASSSNSVGTIYPPSRKTKEPIIHTPRTCSKIGPPI